MAFLGLEPGLRYNTSCVETDALTSQLNKARVVACQSSVSYLRCVDFVNCVHKLLEHIHRPFDFFPHVL